MKFANLVHQAVKSSCIETTKSAVKPNRKKTKTNPKARSNKRNRKQKHSSTVGCCLLLQPKSPNPPALQSFEPCSRSRSRTKHIVLMGLWPRRHLHSPSTSPTPLQHILHNFTQSCVHFARDRSCQSICTEDKPTLTTHTLLTRYTHTLHTSTADREFLSSSLLQSAQSDQRGPPQRVEKGCYGRARHGRRF